MAPAVFGSAVVPSLLRLSQESQSLTGHQHNEKLTMSETDGESGQEREDVDRDPGAGTGKSQAVGSKYSKCWTGAGSGI